MKRSVAIIFLSMLFAFASGADRGANGDVQSRVVSARSDCRSVPPRSSNEPSGASNRHTQAPKSLVKAIDAAASTTNDAHVTFVPMNISIDPHGKPLACYQVRITTTAGDVKLVGVEGGDSQAFNKAPYYDSRALQGNRIVLGAYSLDGKLPDDNTRVATLMLRVAGDVIPRFDATLEVAGTTDGTPIAATVSIMPANSPAAPGR